ncbi:Root cap [Macleaya cordata]|uniref:Root cap n=1 Tax=Macleaya cordata TaxID=56857 RepID=A0A200QK09_MACCD|nr:Root cap [Macleaya cordata]
MFFLIIFLISSLAQLTHADPYSGGAPGAPPPPSAVAGKEFPPQTFFCNDPHSKCFGKNINCPQQCPMLKPASPKDKACFIDCNSIKCEAICMNRKPNCKGIGAACYDPRFVGGDGVMFYFHGKTNEHFSLVSDSNLQINARFIGRRPQGRTRDNTWIQALGFMFNSHTFSLAAKRVAQWDDQVDQLVFTYNNKPLAIEEGHLSTWAASDSQLTVERTANCNSVIVKLPGFVEISVNVVPVTKEDDRIHKYQIPSDDCFAHLEVQFKFLDLSEKVEGVLGQTYRPGFENPVKRGVAMPIMGGEDKYKTSSLLSADCKYCIFSPENSDGSANSLVLDPTMTTVDCTSRMSNGRGIVCRR